MANLNLFIETIGNLKGLSSETIRELTQVAPKLSDEEREKAMNELTLLNRKLIKSRKIIVKLSKKAKQTIQNIKSKFIPEMRKLREKNEHEGEMKDIEKYFD